METFNTKNKHAQKVILLFILLTGAPTFYSCSDDDDSQTPTKPETETIFKYKAKDIAEFKQISADNKVQEIPASQMEEYFGERITLASPNELQLKEDSLYIIKPGKLTEGYKIKWDDKKLLIFKDQTATWECCGEQKSDDQFLLNIGFYIKRSEDNNRRKLFVTGQEYALQSYSDITDNTTSTIWLKATYTFIH